MTDKKVGTIKKPDCIKLKRNKTSANVRSSSSVKKNTFLILWRLVAVMLNFDYSHMLNDIRKVKANRLT